MAAEPETQFLITEILRPFRAKLTQLISTAITVVEEAMSAMKNDEPDHFTRLRAVERYCELLAPAPGKVQEQGNNDAGRLITWEEFQELYGS
jgi:hypothetical protein